YLISALLHPILHCHIRICRCRRAPRRRRLHAHRDRRSRRIILSNRTAIVSRRRDRHVHRRGPIRQPHHGVRRASRGRRLRLHLHPRHRHCLIRRPRRSRPRRCQCPRQKYILLRPSHRPRKLPVQQQLRCRHRCRIHRRRHRRRRHGRRWSARKAEVIGKRLPRRRVLWLRAAIRVCELPVDIQVYSCRPRRKRRRHHHLHYRGRSRHRDLRACPRRRSRLPPKRVHCRQTIRIRPHRHVSRSKLRHAL